MNANMTNFVHSTVPQSTHTSLPNVNDDSNVKPRNLTADKQRRQRSRMCLTMKLCLLLLLGVMMLIFYAHIVVRDSSGTFPFFLRVLDHARRSRSSANLRHSFWCIHLSFYPQPNQQPNLRTMPLDSRGES